MPCSHWTLCPISCPKDPRRIPNLFRLKELGSDPNLISPESLGLAIVCGSAYPTHVPGFEHSLQAPARLSIKVVSNHTLDPPVFGAGEPSGACGPPDPEPA